MSIGHGRFCWYELMTTDKAAARAFYTKVVDWGTQDMEMPGMTYTMFKAGDQPVSGLMDLPENARKMGAPPAWIGYVAVDDVDAAAAKAKGLGARIHVPPTDIPNVGRFAALGDPQGAIISLFKGGAAGDTPLPRQDMTGGIGWHELYAADWEKAFAFYGEMFGWQKAEAMDMGEMGTYQIFKAGEVALGGMMNKPKQMPVPAWQYYLNVADIDAATARVTSEGGQVLIGPMQVPGGDWVIHGRDPQGAVFALFGKRKA
jgi:predicted enzyme related to lactoylglutathione lyase